MKRKLTAQEEEYVHFVECIKSLNIAWTIIDDINETSYEGPLIGYAFRFALIEYSKPYNISRGDIKPRHKLGTEFIPKELLTLHKRIIDSRDQIHAHSDLTLMEAQLSISEIDGYRDIIISKNNFHGLEEISHIDEIRSLIERTLDNMYARQKELESAL